MGIEVSGEYVRDGAGRVVIAVVSVSDGYFGRAGV